MTYLRKLITRAGEKLTPKKTWHYIQGTEPIPIKTLISPLRYDILIRVEFYKFLLGNLDLYHKNFAEFTSRARDHQYYKWYKDRRLFIAKKKSEVINTEMINKDFETRIKNSADLYFQLRKNNFNMKRPVTILGGDTILPTQTGKFINNFFFPGDGCHRIAILLLKKNEILLPETYRIKHLQKLMPIDKTHRLIGPLEMNKKEYFSFLSMGYADTLIDSKELLLENVRKNNPERLIEIKRVIEIDELEFERARRLTDPSVKI
ncbi:MAG: hypothetical protein ACFFCW_48615 [Candidatus Hodarchaeota archaeon]